MQNSLWKLAALAGVIGLGFLVVLQAQRGLSIPGLQEQSQTPIDPDSPQAALDAGEEPPSGDLGSPAQLTQIAPDQNQGPSEDPFAAGAANGDAPQWETGEPASAEAPPFAFGDEPAAAADVEPQPPATPAALPGPATFADAGSPPANDDPFAADGNFFSNSPAPDDSAAPEADPFASTAADAGAEPPATDEPADPAAVARVPAQPVDAESSTGPQFGVPAELDDMNAASARPLPSAARPMLPPPDGTAFSRAGAESGPGPELTQVSGAEFSAEDQPAFGAEEDVAADPFAADAEAPEEGASTDEDGPGVARVRVPAAEPRVPADPGTESEDPFGPFVVSEDPPTPNVEAPADAFPADEGSLDSGPASEGPWDTMPAVEEAVPAEPESPNFDDAVPVPTRAGAFDPRVEEADPFAGGDYEPPAPAEDERSIGTVEPEGEAPPEEPIRQYDREVYGDPFGDGATGDTLPSRPETLDRVPAEAESTTGIPERAPAELPPADALRGVGTVDPRVPRGPQEAQLKIEKVAPPSAVLGQKLVYDIRVKNIGNSTAYEVVVEDRVPRGSRLEGTNPQAELVSQSKKLVWRLGQLEPGAERAISVCVIPLEEGQIGSVATVNFVSEVAAQTVVSAPKLDFVLAGPRQAAMGSDVTFTFKLRNAGSADAANVWIRNLLPEQLRHPDGNDLEYEVGTLPAGESREVTLTLTAAKAGEALNRAVVTADGGAAVESVAPIQVIASAVSVERTGPKQRYLGRPAVFTNTVINEAQQPLDGVVIVETVPDGFQFVEAGDGGQFDPARRTVTWRLDRVPAMGRLPLTVTYLPTTAGTFESVVTVAAAGGGRAEVHSETDVAGFAALNLEVPAVESPVAVGEQVALRIAARNRGTTSATNVRVTVTVPDELEVVAVQGPEYTLNGRQIAFDVLPEVGGNRQAEIDVVLRARAPGNARVSAEIASDQLERPLSREEIIYVLPSN